MRDAFHFGWLDGARWEDFLADHGVDVATLPRVLVVDGPVRACALTGRRRIAWDGWMHERCCVRACEELVCACERAPRRARVQGKLFWEDPSVDSIEKVAGHLGDILAGSVSYQVRGGGVCACDCVCVCVGALFYLPQAVFVYLCVCWYVALMSPPQREGWLGAPGRAWVKMSRIHLAAPWVAVALAVGMVFL